MDTNIEHIYNNFTPGDSLTVAVDDDNICYLSSINEETRTIKTLAQGTDLTEIYELQKKLITLLKERNITVTHIHNEFEDYYLTAS